MIITRTPYRISFFGGGSDYPSYYRQYGGKVLGATIDKYCWLTVRRTPLFGKRFKIVYAKTEECNHVDEIKHPGVRETLKEMGCRDGAEIYHTSDLPARSGVGSSSAFVVGLVQALAGLDAAQWEAAGWTPARIAQAATDIERFRCFETVGSQDQILCAFGGLNTIEFPPGEESNPVIQTLHLPKALGLLNDRLLLFYTGIQRLASDVASSYVRELYQRPATMRRLVQMVDDGKTVLEKVEAGSRYTDAFGYLLNEAWELKKSLGAGISTDKINTIYDAARSAGALGGKLLGAGGGGFLLFYAEPEKQEDVRKAVTSHGCQEVPFKFENAGSTLVYNGESCAA